MHAQSRSCVELFEKPWTVAHQAGLSMGFFRQEYWSGLPFPSPRNLPHPGTELVPPVLAGEFLNTEPPTKPFLQLFLLFVSWNADLMGGF